MINIKWSDEEKKALIYAYENRINLESIDILKNKTGKELSIMARILGLNNKYPDFDYMVGRKFGKLTVLRRVSKDNNGKLLYECACDCGNSKHPIILGYKLRNGESKSCGCYKTELLHKRTLDLVGKRFGYLTVIERDTKDYISPQGVHQPQWICKCDCGNIITVVGNSLRSGHTKSCGCQKESMFKKKMKKLNTYDLTGNYGIGYDSHGNKFYFDKEDFDKIKGYPWYFQNNEKNGYVATKNKIDNSTIMMHRLIMNVSDNNIFVDHIHSDRKYDNRKANLRLASKSQNGMNIGIRSNNTSGTTGVSYNRSYQKWNAYISCNGKRYNLGYYDNINDAIKVRKEAEDEIFGDYSFDNSQSVDIEE